MFVERRVIPASTISAVIINEGLCGWNVGHYLAVLTKVDETQSLHVLYENKLPRMPGLRDVYHNLQVYYLTGRNEWSGQTIKLVQVGEVVHWK